MSPWLALALVIILVGAFAILSRLHLLAIAVTFWITFAIGIAVIAAAGHQMTARWHLGPITGFEFWRVVVLSPEVMVFLFFMITDPKTTPKSRDGRYVYALTVALLAVLLIAPQVTEFWTKVALLGALWIVCAARPVVDVLAPRLQPALHAAGPLPARRRRARRRGRVRRGARARRHPRASRGGRRPGRRSGRHPAAADGPALEGGGNADRPDARAADRERPRRRPPDRGGRAPHPRQGRAPPGLRVGRGSRGYGRRSGPRGRARSSSRSVTSTSSSSSSRPPSARIRRSSSRRPRARSGSSPTTARRRRSRSRARRRRSPERSSSSSTGRATSSSARAAARPRRSHPTRRRSSSPPASAERASRTSPRPWGSTSSRTRSGRRRRWT